MRLTLGLILAAGLFCILLQRGHADPNPYGLPGANTPLTGCVEGRAMRIVNGIPSCAQTAPPTLASCTGGLIDGNSTDFIGLVSLPAGLTSCQVVMTKLYSTPPLVCLAQGQGGLSISGMPTVSASATNTFMTISFALSVSGAKVGYICGPG